MRYIVVPGGTILNSPGSPFLVGDMAIDGLLIAPTKDTRTGLGRMVRAGH